MTFTSEKVFPFVLTVFPRNERGKIQGLVTIKRIRPPTSQMPDEPPEKLKEFGFQTPPLKTES